jgi:hypothetical protein
MRRCASLAGMTSRWNGNPLAGARIVKERAVLILTKSWLANVAHDSRPSSEGTLQSSLLNVSMRARGDVQMRVRPT